MLPTALKFPLVLMLVFCAQSQASRSLQTTESGQDEFSLAEQRETLCAFEKQGFLTELAQETANATVEAIRGDKGNDFADYMLSRMTVFHYIAARALQYAVPLFVGIALIFIALPIALVVLYARPHGKVRRVLCFCCERKIEDLQYKPIKMWEKITIWVFYATCFCGFVFMSVFALAWALNVTDGLQEASCTCFTYAEQILYGTNVSGTEADPDKPFIGLLPAVEALESLHNKLDPDSPDSIVHEIRDIVSDTSPFYDAFSNFRGDLQLMIDNFDNPRNNLIKQKDSFYHGFHRNIMCEVLVDPLNEAIRLTSEGFYDAMAQLHAQLENLLAKGEEGLRNVAAGLEAFSGEDTKKEFLVIAESMANSIHQLFLPLSFAFFIILVIITSAGLLGIFAGVALLVIVEISFWRAKRRHAIIRASRESAQQRRRWIEDPQAAYVERSPMKGKGYTPVKRRDSNESEKEKETEVGTLNRQNSANFLDRNKSELTAPHRSFEEDGGDAREREERAQKVDPLSLPIPTKKGSVTPLMNGEKKKPEVKKKGSGESGRAKDMEEGNLGMQGGLSPGGQSQRDARNRRDLVEHFEIFDELAMIEETRGLSDVDIVYWNPRRWPVATLFFYFFGFATICLIVGGGILACIAPVTDLCRWVRQDLLYVAGWERFFPVIIKELGAIRGAPYPQQMQDMIKTVATVCLSKDGSGTIIEALKITSTVELAEMVEERLEAIEKEEIPLDAVDLSLLDELDQVVDDVSWFVLPDFARVNAELGLDNLITDPDATVASLENELRTLKSYTFNKYIKPQLESNSLGSDVLRILETLGGIRGIEHVEGLAEPFWFTVVRQEGTADWGNRQANDPSSRYAMTEVFDYQGSVAQGETATRSPGEQHAFEAVLFWAQQKARLRRTSKTSTPPFECQYKNGTKTACSYFEWKHFARYHLAGNLRTTVHEIFDLADATKKRLTDDMRRILGELLAFIDALIRGLNCHVMVRALDALAADVCDGAAKHMLLSATGWISLGTICLVAYAIFFALYKRYQDNYFGYIKTLTELYEKQRPLDDVGKGENGSGDLDGKNESGALGDKSKSARDEAILRDMERMEREDQDAVDMMDESEEEEESESDGEALYGHEESEEEYSDGDGDYSDEESFSGLSDLSDIIVDLQTPRSKREGAAESPQSRHSAAQKASSPPPQAVGKKTSKAESEKTKKGKGKKGKGKAGAKGEKGGKKSPHQSGGEEASDKEGKKKGKQGTKKKGGKKKKKAARVEPTANEEPAKPPAATKPPGSLSVAKVAEQLGRLTGLTTPRAQTVGAAQEQTDAAAIDAEETNEKTPFAGKKRPKSGAQAFRGQGSGL